MKRQEEKKGPGPVCYIYGEEDYLAEEVLEEIRTGVLAAGFESLNHHVFEAPAVEPEEAITAARTVPAFSGMRLVVLKNADSLKAAQEKRFLEYVKDPVPTTCFVFMARSSKAAKASGLYKYLSKKGAARACKRLSERDLTRWVTQEARRQGKEITDEAVRKLLGLAGGGLRDVKGELDKIVIFAGAEKVIEEGCVEGAGCEVADETAFGLADAIGRRDASAALRVFAKISREEPLKVLGAISRQFRILLKLKSLLRKRVSRARLPQMVGVSSWYFDGYLESCRRFTEGDLLGAFVKLKGADLALKSSRLPGSLVMSRLIIELCSGRRG